GRPQMACSWSDVSRARQSNTSTMPGCYRASVITFVSRNYDALETSKEEKRDLVQRYLPLLATPSFVGEHLLVLTISWY
ncbi:unnamed protein product, partial [Heterotrigona itama]